MVYDVAIIGCGIIGAATAYELAKYKLSVIVIDKENDIAVGTTKANSAIIHAGYDPKPNTLMARLNIEGARLTKELCEKLSVPYKQIGSMVIAFDKEQIPTLKKLYKQGLENGVDGLKLLNDKQAMALEPNLSQNVCGALYAPTAAIVSPWEYAIALAQTANVNGVDFIFNSNVTVINKTKDIFETTAGDRMIKSRYIINAAGVYADYINNMVEKPEFEIVPSKGEYFLLDKTEGERVSHVIFQCPTDKGKGVLVAPTVHGNLITGPSADNIDDAEDTSTTYSGLDGVKSLALKSVNTIDFKQTIRTFSGVRANSNIDDFIIEELKTVKGFINLAAIKSPGLSSAPAIAKMAVSLLGDSGLLLTEKDDFHDKREKIDFKALNIDEKNELIKLRPEYGRVICRCETITEGEIVDALKSPLPPSSIDGIKRRCSAGMGRCQGGFCSPRVHEIIARELNLPMEKVCMDRDGSFIIIGETKVKL